MKHYFMAFFILFSALSSSWVGAVVFSEQEKVQSNLYQEYSVSGCASVHSEVSADQKMDHEYCVNCFDQCQCDNSTCHKMNSPLVGTHLEPVNTLNISNISIVIVSLFLKNAPIFLDFRPPKNS